MFLFPSFGFKLFVVSVLLVSNLLVFSVRHFPCLVLRFSWIELRIYVFPSRSIRYGFSTIPAGLPGPGLFHLVTVLPFSYLLRKPSTIWRETSRLKNPETGVLGTRKIGTGEYCCITRAQF